MNMNDNNMPNAGWFVLIDNQQNQSKRKDTQCLNNQAQSDTKIFTTNQYPTAIVSVENDKLVSQCLNNQAQSDTITFTTDQYPTAIVSVENDKLVSQAVVEDTLVDQLKALKDKVEKKANELVLLLSELEIRIQNAKKIFERCLRNARTGRRPLETSEEKRLRNNAYQRKYRAAKKEFSKVKNEVQTDKIWFYKDYNKVLEEKIRVKKELIEKVKSESGMGRY